MNLFVSSISGQLKIGSNLNKISNLQKFVLQHSSKFLKTLKPNFTLSSSNEQILHRNSQSIAGTSVDQALENASGFQTFREPNDVKLQIRFKKFVDFNSTIQQQNLLRSIDVPIWVSKTKQYSKVNCAGG
jgi:hypothetical protein